MVLCKFISGLTFFATLAAVPLLADVSQQLETTRFEINHPRTRTSEYVSQAFGKLSASSTIGPLIITSPQGSLPPATGWQPFPVDTFSTSSHMSSHDPSSATIKIYHSGTYLINALLTLQYPTPGSDGPADLTGYVIGIMVNGVLQADSIGTFHISQEAGQENPGLLFSATLSDLVALPKHSTVQFVVAGGTGSASPAFLDVASANATIVRVGDN